MPLYDRLLIRRRLKRISAPGTFVSMLNLNRPDNPPAIMSWADVLIAQVEAQQVVIPDKVLVAVAAIRQGLAERGIEPSDRRFFEAMAVVRAAAWRDGCDVAEPAHLEVLNDICWIQPSQYPEVMAAVEEVLEPLISAADRLMAKVQAIRTQIRSGLSDLDRKRLAIELHDKIKMADKELSVLRRGVKEGRQVAKLDQAAQLIKETSEQIIIDLFEHEVPEKT